MRCLPWLGMPASDVPLSFALSTWSLEVRIEEPPTRDHSGKGERDERPNSQVQHVAHHKRQTEDATKDIHPALAEHVCYEHQHQGQLQEQGARGFSIYFLVFSS